jgi:hypothetical protein
MILQKIVKDNLRLEVLKQQNTELLNQRKEFNIKMSLKKE